MFYFGYVTKEMFIKRLKKELKSIFWLAESISDTYSTTDSLVIAVQNESQFVIRVSTSNVDLGNSLLITTDFCEVAMVKGSNRFEPVYQTQWQNILFGVYERKRLRRYCRRLAREIYDHIQYFNNVEPAEFFIS